MQGKIIKIDSQSSLVLTKDKQLYTSFIKGNIKKNKTPFVGDDVKIEIIDNGRANIIEILERKNSIYRPKVANVDQVIIVTALYRPLFSSYILNKYIMLSESKNIKPILLFTKLDLLKVEKEYPEVLNKVKKFKDFGYDIFIVDNNNAIEYEHEFNKIKKSMENKVSFFTGQTGAGKSTTLNHFLPDEVIKTNETSLKLNRGKHTTTSVKMYPLEHNILIADTPGFSSFELQDIEIEKILNNFTIFKKYSFECKFSNCQHIAEKECGVKKAVENNCIPFFIYNDYKKVNEELKNRKNKY